MEDVRRLVLGSQRINTMRAEIRCVVSTLIGVMTYDMLGKHCQDGQIFEFDHLGLKWVFGRGDRDNVYVAVHLPGISAPIYLTDSRTNVPLGHVAKVHQGLPLLMERMNQALPGLLERLQPLFDAADAAPPPAE